MGLWDRGIVGCGGRGGRGDEDVGTTNIIDTQPPICGRRRRRRSGWMDGWMDGRDGRSRCVRLHGGFYYYAYNNNNTTTVDGR